MCYTFSVVIFSALETLYLAVYSVVALFLYIMWRPLPVHYVVNVIKYCCKRLRWEPSKAVVQGAGIRGKKLRVGGKQVSLGGLLATQHEASHEADNLDPVARATSPR